MDSRELRLSPTLNEEQLQSINSIQGYYKLSSRLKLIAVMLDPNQAEQIFSIKNKSLESRNIQHDIVAQKYSFQKLVQKYPKPKSEYNQLIRAVLKLKQQKQTISSHHTRKSIWLLASGAKFCINNNRGLYQGLLTWNDYPDFYLHAIQLDLKRTVNSATSTQIDQDISMLRNILMTFSRRNPYIGYCQGLNFIAFFLIQMQFTQQQIFWLLNQVLTYFVPLDYYTSMIGVICDKRIFISSLHVMKPKMIQKFDQIGLDPAMIAIQWFVCLFTSSLPFSVISISNKYISFFSLSKLFGIVYLSKEPSYQLKSPQLSFCTLRSRS